MLLSNSNIDQRTSVQVPVPSYPHKKLDSTGRETSLYNIAQQKYSFPLDFDRNQCERNKIRGIKQKILILLGYRTVPVPSMRYLQGQSFKQTINLQHQAVIFNECYPALTNSQCRHRNHKNRQPPYSNLKHAYPPYANICQPHTRDL